MNRQAQAAVMFLVGAAVLHAGFTDLHLRYVKAGLRPLLLAAGIVLIVTAIATVCYELRPRAAQETQETQQTQQTQQTQPEREHHERRDHDQVGHAQVGHAHREPRISWLLILPLLALILVAPPALGSYSAMRTGTALQPPWGFPTLPAGDPLKLSVGDYAGRAVYDHGRSLSGRRLKITGFIALDRSGEPYLVRMALNCCAADAQPVKIGLSGQIPAVLPPDAWLEVIGTYTGKQTKDPVNDGVIPFINVSEARRVPAPHDQYESGSS